MFVASVLFAALLTNAQQIATAVCNEEIGAEFAMTGTVANAFFGDISLVDESGTIHVTSKTNALDGIAVTNGTVVAVEGYLKCHDDNICFARWTKISVISNTPPQQVVPATAADLLSGKLRGHPVQISGIVRECFEDEIDRNFLFFVLNVEGESIYISMRNDPENRKIFDRLADCRVSVTGFCSSFGAAQFRQLMGPHLGCDGSDIRILQHPPADPFAVPLLTRDISTTPAGVAMGGRKRLCGTVLATWDEINSLLADKRGNIHNIRFRKDIPPVGSRIETVGLPETDLFHLNLTDAIWRPDTANANPAPPAEPQEVELATLVTTTHNRSQIQPIFHGKCVRLTGTIVDMAGETARQGRFLMRDGDFTIPVNASTHPGALSDLSTGCRVSVTGICIVETEPWRSHATFPHATGVMLVIRTPDDIQILARPSWWTPQRLLVVIASLLLLVAALLLWNRSLNRIVTRRTRALVREQLAFAEAELKIGERTRLAIELHDSLSQNLAAVACQVSATKSAVKVNTDETMSNLNTVERMLLSCRSELRRCLWDLRNDTLDEHNMTEVIRKVLAPVLGSAKLQVRFNVSRARLDDSTLHTVICIIRELATNAIVHGKATHVSVAGDLTDDILAFSVSENGKGFDTATCRGPDEGHFGLAGIRERIDRLCGTFALQSQPGEGSYAKVTFRLSPNTTED